MSSVFKDAFSVARWSFWTGMALSCLAGAIAYLVTARSIESNARANFLNHTRYAQNVVGVRVKSYADLLRGTGSMIRSTDKLTYQQFRDYVRGLQLPQNFPAVGYLNYAVHVTERERAGFVTQMRADVDAALGGHADVGITPPGVRPDYLAVGYIEPPPPSARLYGIDLLANRYFGNQLSVERDSGRILSSGTAIPVLSRPNDIYIGMRMPVYRAGAPLANVGQRRAAYMGSLGIAFSVPKLLKGIINDMALPGVRMTLYDVGPHVTLDGRVSTGHAQPLFDSLGTATRPEVPLDTGNDVFSVTALLDFNGRPWKTVYSVRKSALYTRVDTWYPALMMLAGFFGSALLYALLHTLAASRRTAIGLAREMTSELQDSQSKLRLSHQKLRRLADHAYQVKEVERKRIAREIHDDLGQNLLALRIEAAMLATRTHQRHVRLHARTRATLQRVDTVIKSVRQIINDLRPTVLDLGLSAAVEWQVNQFERRTGIVCDFHDNHGAIPLPDHCATTFFRILQESLASVVLHATATRVLVDLRLEDGRLTMTVHDNGRGPHPRDRNDFDAFGLVGVEERMAILDGACSIAGEPGRGTTIVVSAPVVDLPDDAPPHPQGHAGGPAVI